MDNANRGKNEKTLVIKITSQYSAWRKIVVLLQVNNCQPLCQLAKRYLTA
jgi:hypothetical protein